MARVVFVAVSFALGALPGSGVGNPALGAAESGVRIVAGSDEATIQSAIDRLNKVGGGRILLDPGDYVLRRGLRFVDARNISLVGRRGTRFVLAPQIQARTAADANAGDRIVELESMPPLAEGMRCEAHAPGRGYQSPDGKQHVCPYSNFTIGSIEGKRITTLQPLRYALPKGTVVIQTYNGILMTGRTYGICIENIDIDMNREQWPVAPLNHTDHCCIFANAAYDYKKGLLGPPIEKIVVRDCVLRNSHHRGIAWYGVARGTITGCRVEHTDAEGVDLDHFCRFCEVKDNRILDGSAGIELNDASECVVQGNRVEDCGRGLNLWRWCEGDDLNVRNQFVGNQILRSRGDAIFCGPRTSLTTLRNNRIDQARGKGIHVAGDRNAIEANEIGRCEQEAVLLLGSGNSLRENRCADGGAVADRGKDNDVRP